MLNDILESLSPQVTALGSKLTQATARAAETGEPSDMLAVQQMTARFTELLQLLSTIMKICHDANISIIQKM